MLMSSVVDGAVRNGMCNICRPLARGFVSMPIHGGSLPRWGASQFWIRYDRDYYT